jgi:Flp pilus assembly protein TadG
MARFPVIRSALRPLARCDRGVSAIEFAVAAPLLFLFVIGMFEVALMTFVSVSAEAGLREAARFGLTGQMASDETAREQKILEIFDNRTLGMIDLSRATITLKSYESFNDVGQPEPFTDTEPLNGVYDEGEIFIDLNDNGRWDEDRGIDGVGKAGDVVLYRVDYEWSLLTPIVAQLLGKGGRLPMSASVVVRNEPWEFARSAAN